ncbi:MAG: hypothetical protein Q9187_000152 [Circinaria calcarea]
MGAVMDLNGIGTDEKKRSQPARQKRPNYNVLHAHPLPLRVHPLPPLIPHNPLSLLQIAYTYISHLLSPPSSHPPVKYQGYWSPETRSVHIIDEADGRALWENGFFGKGSLSRSEPSWLDREKRKKGLIAGETSEEITRKRREERREFKKERARKEREVIEAKMREETRSDINDTTNIVAIENLGHSGVESLPTNGETDGIPSTGTEEPKRGCNRNRQDSASKADVRDTVHLEIVANGSTQALKDIGNQEHLQLTSEEAFFLAYGLGVLNVSDSSTVNSMPTDQLFNVFRTNSYFPPCEVEELQPDDPFLMSYIVYHHFRSLGWVVRPGVKFAVDYLLYNRGPVFSHAEFAVMILPSYTHQYWHDTEERATKIRKKERKSWWWLHCVNRVQSQVRKSLVLVYVEVPPPLYEIEIPLEPPKSAREDHGVLDITAILRRYKVRELTLKRWIPNRSRD